MRDDDAAARAAEVLAPVGTASRDGKLVRVNVPGGAGARSMLEAVRILDGEHLDPATMVAARADARRRVPRAHRAHHERPTTTKEKAS